MSGNTRGKVEEERSAFGEWSDGEAEMEASDALLESADEDSEKKETPEQKKDRPEGKQERVEDKPPADKPAGADTKDKPAARDQSRATPDQPVPAVPEALKPLLGWMPRPKGERPLETLESADAQVVVIGEVKPATDRAKAPVIFEKMLQAAGADRPVSVALEIPVRYQNDLDLFMQGKMTLDEISGKVGADWRPLLDAAGKLKEKGFKIIAVGDETAATAGSDYQKRVMGRIEAERARTREAGEKEPHVAIWLNKVDAGQLNRDLPGAFVKKTDDGIDDARPPERRVEGSKEKVKIVLSEREKALVREISELSKPDVIAEKDFVRLVSRFTSQADKNLAAEILEQVVPNLQQFGKPNPHGSAPDVPPYPSVDVQLRNIFDQIAKKEGGPVSELVVVVPREADVGNALGYLQRTAVKDLKVTIKVLDADTIADGISPARPVLMFGNPKDLDAKQLELLKKVSKLYVTDLNGFEKGPNLFDMAAARVSGSTQAIDAKMDRLLADVKKLQESEAFKQDFERQFGELKGTERSKKFNEMAIRQVLQSGLADVTSLLPNAEVVQPKTALRRGGKVDRGFMPSREAQMEQLYRDQIGAPRAAERDVEDLLKILAEEKKLTPTERELALRMLKDGINYNSYPRQLEQMAVLHKKLIESLPPGKSVSDIAILTHMEDSSSADLIHHLFARQHGLKAENFVPLKDFHAHPERYKDKVLVLLDDASYSGGQTEKLLVQEPEKGVKNPTLEAIGKSQAQFRIAYLGEYLDPARQLEKFPPHFKPQIIAAERLGQFFDPENLARKYGITKEQAQSIAGSTGYRHSGERTVISGTVNPNLGHPNNNVEIVRNFIARVMKHEVNAHGMRGEKFTRQKAPESQHGPLIWHGASPDNAEHMADILRKSKADIVIDLRGADPLEKERLELQQKWFRELRPDDARNLINIPTPTELPMPGTPKYDDFLKQIHAFETIMAKAKAEGKAVYFHCHWGQDRTGLMRALHEVLADGKPANKALEDWTKLKQGKFDASFRNLYHRETFEQILLDYRLRYPERAGTPGLAGSADARPAAPSAMTDEKIQHFIDRVEKDLSADQLIETLHQRAKDFFKFEGNQAFQEAAKRTAIKADTTLKPGQSKLVFMSTAGEFTPKSFEAEPSPGRFVLEDGRKIDLTNCKFEIHMGEGTEPKEAARRALLEFNRLDQELRLKGSAATPQARQRIETSLAGLSQALDRVRKKDSSPAAAAVSDRGGASASLGQFEVGGKIVDITLTPAGVAIGDKEVSTQKLIDEAIKDKQKQLDETKDETERRRMAEELDELKKLHQDIKDGKQVELAKVQEALQKNLRKEYEVTRAEAGKPGAGQRLAAGIGRATAYLMIVSFVAGMIIDNEKANRVLGQDYAPTGAR